MGSQGLLCDVTQGGVTGDRRQPEQGQRRESRRVGRGAVVIAPRAVGQSLSVGGREEEVRLRRVVEALDDRAPGPSGGLQQVADTGAVQVEQRLGNAA